MTPALYRLRTGHTIQTTHDGYLGRTSPPLPDGAHIAVASGDGVPATACEAATADGARAAAFGVVEGWRG